MELQPKAHAAIVLFSARLAAPKNGNDVAGGYKAESQALVNVEGQVILVIPLSGFRQLYKSYQSPNLIEA